MMVRFRSGYLNYVLQPGNNMEVGLAYPDWWLQAIGYDRFPQPPALTPVSQSVSLPPYKPPILVPPAPGMWGVPPQLAGPTPPTTPPLLAAAAGRGEAAAAWAAPLALGAALGVAALALAQRGARALGARRAAALERAGGYREPLVRAEAVAAI
jgi:hypothetical protein